MASPQTTTFLVTQALPVGHSAYPSEAGLAVPRNYTQAVVELTGATTIAVGAHVDVLFLLSWDNRATWSPAASLSFDGGGVPAGSGATVPLEGATHFKAAVDVAGTPATLGVRATLT